MTTRRRRRAAATVVAIGLALGACTDGAPTPDQSVTDDPSTADPVPVDERDRIGIVVGPTSHVSSVEAAALEEAARALAEDPPPDTAEVRVVVARSEAFAGDLVELLVDEGYDVVCVVGSGAAPLLVAAARRHRGTQLCGTDAAIEGGPENIVAVAIDPGAFATLTVAATGALPAPVGLVVGPEVGSVEVVEPLLESGLPTPAAPAPVPTPPVPASPPPSSPTPDPPSAAEEPRAVVAASTVDSSTGAAVDQVLRAGPSVVALLVPRSADEVARLATAGVRTVVVDDWVRGGDGDVLPGGVLAAFTVDRAAQLRAAVAAARTPNTAQVSLLTLADGVLGVTAGPALGAELAVERVEAVLADVSGGAGG